MKQTSSNPYKYSQASHPSQTPLKPLQLRVRVLARGTNDDGSAIRGSVLVSNYIYNTLYEHDNTLPMFFSG